MEPRVFIYTCLCRVRTLELFVRFKNESMFLVCQNYQEAKYKRLEKQAVVKDQ